MIAIVHVGTGLGFAAGFSHPWSGLDHLLAMLALGMWAARLGGRAMWLLPIAFPIAMAIGGFAAMAGLVVPGVEVAIALSVLLLAAAVFLRARVNLGAALLLAALFGFFHGHAHGTELPAGASGFLFAAGFTLSTATLHCIGIAIGRVRFGAYSGATARSR